MLKKLLLSILTIIFIASPLSGLAQGIPTPNPVSSWKQTDKTITKTIDGKDYQFDITLGGGSTDIYDSRGEEVKTKNVLVFDLIKWGDIYFTEIPKLSIVVDTSLDSSENIPSLYGKIIYIGYRKASNEAFMTGSIVLKDSREEEGMPMRPINSVVVDQVEEKRPEALSLYSYLNDIVSITSTGKISISDANVYQQHVDEDKITDTIFNACKTNLPTIVDLENPPEEIQKAFEQWNEQFKDKEKLHVPVINDEIKQTNRFLYNSIISSSPQYIASSNQRSSAVSTQLNQLNNEIEQIWKKDDEESTGADQIKGCIGATIAGAVAGSTIPGIGTAGGAIVAGGACLGGSYGTQKLADLFYGTNVPKYYTINVLAIYYETKYLSYLNCIKNHEDYSNLPEELREKIETEITRIEGEIKSLANEGENAIDQSQDGSLKGIAKILAGWLEEMFIKIFELIEKLFDGVPV